MTTTTVTVLFTDHVGSTALMSRIGEERSETLRREQFTLIREAVYDSKGTEVKNLGDGLMAVFNSASGAVSCAVAIQQAVDRRNRGADEQIAIRVGIATGEADLEDGDYFGAPVIEASRLCSKAEGSEILITEMVKVMVRSRGGFEFEPLGEFELKGLEAPIGLSRVRWTPRVTTSDLTVPLPSRLNTTTALSFVGRVKEREALKETLNDVVSGKQQTLFLSGEPGIGKTALISEFAREAINQGLVILYGRCDEEAGIPYKPWVESLTFLVQHATDEVLESHVRNRGGSLSLLARDLGQRTGIRAPGTSDAESDRYALFEAVLDLFERVSELTPIVLVLDDLHWADTPTVQLLRHIMASDRRLRLLIVGTFRDSEVSGDHPMTDVLASSHQNASVRRFTLRGLGDDEVLSLLEAIAGHEMTGDGVALRDALLAETAGNPFFVTEVLRHLAETRAIYRDENGRWVASSNLRMTGLPVSVREVVRHRVVRLGGDALRVLSLAAVIGGDFDIALLAQVADLPEDSLLDLCDKAVAAAVILDTGDGARYGFVHALIEHTLYEDLSRARRARAHRAVAEALEDLYGDEPGERIGDLAYHWAQATQPQDMTKAIEYAQRAAERALEQLAPDEAVRWYRQAAELSEHSPHPDPTVNLDLKIGLGIAQRQSGDSEYRDTLVGAARQAIELDEADRLVAAALANHRGFAALFVVDEERVKILEAAIERIPDDHPKKVLLLATLFSELSYDGRAAGRESLVDEAVLQAAGLSDDAAAAHALTLLVTSLSVPPLVNRSNGVSLDAVARAEASGDDILVYWAHSGRTQVAARTAQIDDHNRSLERLGGLVSRLKLPTISWDYAVLQAAHHLLLGSHAMVEVLATEALELGLASGQPDAAILYATQIMLVNWQRGTVHELIPLVAQTAKETPDAPVFGAALTMALAEAGRDDEATVELEKFARNNFDIPMNTAWLTGMVALTDATVLLGDRDAAQILFDILQPWGDQLVFEYGSVGNHVSHYLGCLAGLIGQYEQADECFKTSAAFNEAANAKFLGARTDLEWGRLLLAGDSSTGRARAPGLLSSAYESATKHGYAFVASRARRELENLNKPS